MILTEQKGTLIEELSVNTGPAVDALPVTPVVKPTFVFERPEIIMNDARLISDLPEFSSSDITTFMAAFNQRFLHFERNINLKLNLGTCLANQAISCTGASIIVGVWFEKNFGRQPLFLLEVTGLGNIISRYAHSVVFLPAADYQHDTTTPDSIQAGWDDLVGKGELIEYLRSGLAVATSPVNNHVRLIGIRSFIEHRSGVSFQ